jgi:hypothetical protein
VWYIYLPLHFERLDSGEKIYILTAIGFSPSGSGPYTVHKYKINCYIHKEKECTKQYKKPRTHKIESKTNKE